MPMQFLVIAYLLTFAYSQAVALSLLVLAAALLVFGRMAQKRLPHLNAKDALFLMYGFVAAIPVAIDPTQLSAWVLVVAHPWLVSFVFQNLVLTPRRVAMIGACLYVVAIALAGEMLFQVRPGQFDVSVDRLLSVNRNLGFYFRGREGAGPTTAATMSAVAIVLVLASLKFWRGRPWAKIVAIALPVAFLVVAGGRNAWVGTVACAGLFLLYRPTTMGRRTRLWGRSLILLALLGGGAMAYAAISGAQGDLLAERLTLLLNPSSDTSVQYRLIAWGKAFEMIQDGPWGWGFDAFVTRYGMTAHNELLAQVLGAGWLGGVLYVCLIGYLWWHVLTLRRDTPVADAIRFTALSFLTLATLAMVTENQSRAGAGTFAPMMWAVVGMAFGVRRRVRVANRATQQASGPARPLIVSH